MSDLSSRSLLQLKDGKTGEPIHHRKWDSSVMDLPLVNSKEQRRPSLKAGAVNQLVKESEGDEQALYVLLGATGLRVSEALALESKHFINDGRTIEVSATRWIVRLLASCHISKPMPDLAKLI